MASLRRQSHRYRAGRLVCGGLLTLLCVFTSELAPAQSVEQPVMLGVDSTSDSTLPPSLPPMPSHWADSGTGPWPYRPMTNYSFGVAETLWYDVGWQSIVAGKGTMYVNEPVDTNRHLCYPIYSTVKSTPFFSAFFRVDDSAITFMDVRQMYPLRFEKYLREGKYESDRLADFDSEWGLAYTPGDTLVVPPYVQDPLSLLYHVRAMELEPGTDIQVENYSGKEVYTLTVRILRRERIKVKAGTFSTLVVEPLLQAAGLFKHEGRLTVWLTDDRLHLPVLMKSKVLVGSIVAELTDYRLGRIQRFKDESE